MYVFMMYQVYTMYVSVHVPSCITSIAAAAQR